MFQKETETNKEWYFRMVFISLKFIHSKLRNPMMKLMHFAVLLTNAKFSTEFMRTFSTPTFMARPDFRQQNILSTTVFT